MSYLKKTGIEWSKAHNFGIIQKYLLQNNKLLRYKKKYENGSLDMISTGRAFIRYLEPRTDAMFMEMMVTFKLNTLSIWLLTYTTLMNILNCL